MYKYRIVDIHPKDGYHEANTHPIHGIAVKPGDVIESEKPALLGVWGNEEWGVKDYYFGTIGGRTFHAIKVEDVTNEETKEPVVGIPKATSQPSPPRSQWISVKDRLPEDNHEHLVLNNNLYDLARFIHEKQEWECLHNDTPLIHHITHWMPLPKRP